jgi:16S rRNA (cytosine1402-N4)-methyltransferase
LDFPHRPVLVEEVMRYLVVNPSGVYVDGTVGPGGHGEAIGRRLSERGQLIGLDRDPEAVRLARHRLSFLGVRSQVLQASYTDLDVTLMELGVEGVAGVLLDLGMSSYQLSNSGRGFSFSRDEPLDMRMDPRSETTAFDLVNKLSSKNLEGLLRRYGEEKRAKAIVKRIAHERRKKPIETALQLANLVISVFPPSYRHKAPHPATRTFQALRIAVNRELDNLELFLDKIPAAVMNGGRVVIISYHSLEDRMVKRAMVQWEKGCVCPADFPYCTCGRVPLFKRLLKKGLKPEKREVEVNPRARSAIMRAAERI